jgi:hypothetical protein
MKPFNGIELSCISHETHLFLSAALRVTALFRGRRLGGCLLLFEENALEIYISHAQG